MSENACDGYYNSAVFSPIEMPGSPSSVSSDSTNTTEYMSQPSSPTPEDASTMSCKMPLKSSLRRAGQPSTRPRRTVTWDPNTVFETRPWLGKRRRSQVEEDEEENDLQGARCCASFNDDLTAAPTPCKKAKFAESTTTTTTVHQTSLANTTSCLPIFPEASRIVIPMFDFSSVLPLETRPSQLSNASTSSTVHPTPSSSSPSERPSVVSFSLTPKRQPIAVRSNLIAASVAKF